MPRLDHRRLAHHLDSLMLHQLLPTQEQDEETPRRTSRWAAAWMDGEFLDGLARARGAASDAAAAVSASAAERDGAEWRVSARWAMA